MNDLETIVAEVLAEHRANANPLHCECGWFNNELAHSDRFTGWKDEQAIAEHRAHLAEQIAERLGIELFDNTRTPELFRVRALEHLESGGNVK